MKKGSITKLKLNPRKPPKTDWRIFDTMSEEERHQAALSDPDAPPATEAQLARARRVPKAARADNDGAHHNSATVRGGPRFRPTP